MRSNNIILLLIASVFTSYTVFSQSYHVRIGCIGNSITYGSGLSSPETDCYPSQLQKLLEEQFGDTCIVKNFAVSGRTMLKNGDYPIWDEPVFNEAYMYASDIVLILLGTNDSKPQNWDVYGQEFYDDYISMIDTFMLRNPLTKFVICYPPPAFEIKWGIRDSVIAHGVIPAIDSVLDNRDAVFVDFYTPLIDSANLFPDMIHPDVEGSAVMAQIVMDKIIETDLVHQADTGNTFITKFTSKEKRVPVDDSATFSWITINADSVWLEEVPVDSIGTKKILMKESGFITLTAKGKKSSDTMSIFMETYIQEISRIQIDPYIATANINDEIDLTVMYFDQNRLQIEDTITDITWELHEGEGEFKNQEKNKITFVVGNQAKATIYATYGELTAETRITVEDVTALSSPEGNSIINLYPNPVSDKLNATFELNNLHPVLFKITDTKGSILKTGVYQFENCGTKNIVLDFESLPRGLYVVQIEISGKTFSEKILKE